MGPASAPRYVTATDRTEDQRDGVTCNGGGAGLRAGVAAGCGGGTEILSRMSCSAACSLVVISRAIRSCPAAISSTLWRNAARSNDITLSSCRSGEGVAIAIVVGAVCATAACGANQSSCGYELAIISLTVSPYD